MSIAQIKELALALPVEQRVDLAQLLWNSLDNHPMDTDQDESAFQQELLRRNQEMSSDPTSCFSHEDVMTEARRRI